MTTLEELATYENFQTWTFGRLEAALACAADTDKRRNVSMGMPPSPTWDEDAPWTGEPDKIQWIDPTTKYDCLIVRNHMGALCGYVGVPPGHPFHGVDYGTCPVACEQDRDEDAWEYCEHRPDQMVTVHGGVNFAEFCQPGEPVDGICHRAMDGRPDNVWWFGFDCAHGWDVVPSMGRGFNDILGSSELRSQAPWYYKDVGYVSEQVTAEALQLLAVADTPGIFDPKVE